MLFLLRVRGHIKEKHRSSKTDLGRSPLERQGLRIRQGLV